MVKKTIPEVARNFDEFPVEQERRRALPLNKLRSRLPTAIIFGFHGRKKQVIKMLLVLSNSSRAFIITQGGLRGFLLAHHNNSASWLYELQLSAKFRTEAACFLSQTELEDLPKQLGACKTEEEKETCLRHVYPTTYVALLRSIGRTKELDRLYDGTITPDNYTWYIHAELLPKLNKLRSEGRLAKGKKIVGAFYQLCRANEEDMDMWGRI